MEYIDKAVLTQEQSNEIEKIVNKFIKEHNQDVKIGYTILSTIVLILVVVSTFIGIKGDEWIYVISLIGLIFIPSYIFTFFANNFEKEYVIIKAKVIQKQIENYNKGPALLIVKLLSKNKVYKFGATNKSYSKIKKNEIRYLVVLEKNNSVVISGKIILDITDMIEGVIKNY